MTSLETDAITISTVLNRLENLETDTYIIAFGPKDKQFIATPNGYAATHLPAKILANLAGTGVKRVIWASIGDQPESWFYSFQLTNGSVAIRLGDGAPDPLREYIQQISKSDPLLATLRAQLGQDGAFVVWSQTAWACCNVPIVVRDRLCQLSSANREVNGVTMGSFKNGTLHNVQWHSDGSYYVKAGDHHFWQYRTGIMREAWITLWKENVDGHIRSVKLNELAYVTIDPHALTSETFAFFKKQKEDEEPAFILRFGQEPVQARLSPINKPSAQDTSLQHMPRKPDVPAHFTWATSKKTGRPHANDGWEYEMRSGEKVRVMKDAGRNWYIVSGRTGVTGYCHSSWLDFGDGHHHEDPKTAYVRFLKDIQEVLVSGNLREFPAMPSYIDTCTKPECQQVKEDEASVGICVHDLMVLLGGSGCYSHEWLKESRNMWHPDRFSRYCVPAVADQLKAKAQQMFVLYGLLMEMV